MNKLALARRKYEAEGIDSLLVDFSCLPINRIRAYIVQVEMDIERKRSHLSIVN